MTDLSKPGTPGPWAAVEQDRSDGAGEWFGEYEVWAYGAESHALTWHLASMTPVARAEDAAAIADLWGWVERAERFEEALREIAGSTDAIADLWQIAADALRDEGRL